MDFKLQKQHACFIESLTLLEDRETLERIAQAVFMGKEE